MLSFFDYTLFFVLATSSALGVWRGLVGEVIALLSWVIAIVGARLYGGEVANTFLVSFIKEPWLLQIIGTVLVGFVILVALGIFRSLITKVVEKSGLGFSNSFLGFLFGLLRGILIMLLIVLVAGFTNLPREPWWREAVTSSYFVSLAEACKEYLPEMISSRINY